MGGTLGNILCSEKRCLFLTQGTVLLQCWSGTFSPAFPTRFWTAQAHCWTTHATERDFTIEQTKAHTARGPPWHLLSWKFSLTFERGLFFLTKQLSQKGWEPLSVQMASVQPQTVLQVAEENIHRPSTLYCDTWLAGEKKEDLNSNDQRSPWNRHKQAIYTTKQTNTPKHSRAHTCARARAHTHTHTHTHTPRQSGHHFIAFTQRHSGSNAKLMKTKFSQASS